MTTVLDVTNLSVTIGISDVVHDLSFSVDSGEILAIIGANGAGKTSALRAISGDLMPAHGQILFNNRPLSEWRPAEKALGLAVLTQANPLSFAFTVSEVVALGRTPHSTGVRIDNEICEAAMAALDVTHLQARSYPSLSGGEKQRVQLARVMAQIWQEEGPRRLLLLDEPATSLDLGHQRQLMRAVRTFANSGVGVVMVVHDVSLAAAYSDRMLALDRGRAVACGVPEQVVTQALINTLFDTEVQVIPHPKTGKPVVVLAE
jgi:iron complex transport system ATP-binding protein